MTDRQRQRKSRTGTLLTQAVEEYILYHVLAAETVAWYRRVVSVFRGWLRATAKREPRIGDFNGQTISQCLLDKQVAGRSLYYVKSLRGGLVAVLRAIRGDSPVERVRTIKVPPLEPEGWTAEEVRLLLSPGCDPMTPASRFKWELCINLGHYLGLDRCDIEQLEQKHFNDNGALIYRRRKTGAAPTSGIPKNLLRLIRTQCPQRGPICRMGISKEWFRTVFASIVRRAGLHGTFKKLRKSSGSLVELHNAGHGHKHLANTRAIFEKFYEVRRITRREKTMPPTIRLPRLPPNGPRPAA
jgi:hypothetical protein